MEKNLKVAVILSAVDKMSRVIGGAVDGSVKKLSALSKKSSEIGSKAFEVGRSAGAIGLAIAAPIGMAMKAAAQYETMGIALRTSFQGNQKAADAAFKSINEFAAKTPYELEEVMRGFIKLKNMGLDPSQRALTAYGNIASGMGKSLNDMVEAVADAATGEFERLKEFGIKASSQGNRVKFTFQGVTTTVKKNSKDIENYLKKIGETKFKGGIEAQSKSLAGQMSTLKDNFNAVAAKLGATLIPMANRLFAAITPIIEKVTAWIDKNPELAQQIMMVAAGAAAASFAVSGLSFVFGGIMKVVSFVSSGFKTLINVLGFLNKSFFKVLEAVKMLTTFLMANPIILIITAIAVSVFLIIKYWDQIKAFFIKLWGYVKQIFWKVVAWIKEWGILFIGPIGFIIKYWDKLKVFFDNFWENMKELILSFGKWFTDQHIKFFEAGANIIKSIWEGMKSMANKPIEEIKSIVGKIRDHLPFSPAKVGPLRDIHRIKLVETIASNVKPGPLVKAMRTTTAAAMVAATPAMATPKAAPSANPARGGMSSSVNYSPTINVQGGADTASFERLLKQHESKIVKVVEEANRKAARTKF